MKTPTSDIGKARRRWPATICCGLYLLLTILEFGPLSSLGAGQITGTETPDQIQQVWFLQWAEFAISHGHNPLFTQWQNYPVGLNSLANTTMLALGIVFSPMTSLFGPVVTWNVLLRLAVVLSATSMCLVLHRWVKWWPAAFVGGLLYGFCGYITFYGSGYLFLVFAPLPPLIFLLVHEVLGRQQWRPALTGGLLGATCTLQYFISPELMTSTVLMGAIGGAFYLFLRRREYGARWPYLKVAIVSSVFVGGALLAYPVLFSFFGPAHIKGVPKLTGVQGDLLGPFVPGSEQLIASHYSKSVWTQFEVYFYAAPMYMGIPFFVAFGSVLVWLRSRRIVLLAGAMAAVSFVLSLGSTLYIGGHSTHVPLPFIILAHIPVVEGLVANRFSLFTALFGAAVLAMGIDEIHRRLSRSNRPEWLAVRWRRSCAVAGPLALAAVVALPLVPSHTQPVSSTRVSPFFTSRSISSIPTGSVVLAYPYPSSPNHLQGAEPPFVETVDDAQLGQAVSGLRFKLIGGYGWVPPLSVDAPNPTPLAPQSVQTLFNASFYGTATPAQRELVSRSSLTSDLRTFLRRYHVGTVIVLHLGTDPARVVSHVTVAIGPPARTDGVTVWFHVQERLGDTAGRTTRSSG